MCNQEKMGDRLSNRSSKNKRLFGYNRARLHRTKRKARDNAS